MSYKKLFDAITKQTEKLLDDDTQKEILHNRLIKLSKLEMRIVGLYLFDGLSFRNIGSKLNLRHSSVRFHYRKALNKLKYR